MNRLLVEDFQKQSSNTKVLATEMEILRQKFTFPLPKAYVDFMTTYGAVLFNYPLPNAVSVDFYQEKQVASLLSVLEPLDVYEVYLYLKEDSYYGGEAIIQSAMIPIIDVVGGDDDDHILINLEDGSIWINFFGTSIASDKNTFGFIASSFDTFLEKIDDYENLINE